MLTAIGCAWLLAELSVVRWVTLLGRAAEAIGRGDLTHRASIPKRAREFFALASRFNEMAALLAQRHKQLLAAKEAAEAANDEVHRSNERLEQRVADRTTALVTAQEELLRKERLSTLGELTATVAHELRNPLSAIKNTVYALRQDEGLRTLGKEPQITRIERSIARCDRIIAELLDYSRDSEPKISACVFDQWLGETLEEVPIPAEMALALDLNAGATWVTIDCEQFRRVVVNLVENAVQAMAEITPPPDGHRLVISTRATDNGLVAVIGDTGPGITVENLPRIFEPLFSTKSFGTGLGLPLVKRIVNRHGGDITIESHPGIGTRVVLQLWREAATDVVPQRQRTVPATAA
jgi:signal transduction histidine kinase